MLIRYWMNKPVITVEKNDSMQRAAALMKENHIRLLPVVDKGKLCGIVSDRDLKRASASDATSLDVHELLYLISKIRVADIMTRDVVTVNQNWTVEEAADLMLDRKISGAPVVDERWPTVRGHHPNGPVQSHPIHYRFEKTGISPGLRPGRYPRINHGDRQCDKRIRRTNGQHPFNLRTRTDRDTAMSTFDSMMFPGIESMTC